MLKTITFPMCLECKKVQKNCCNDFPRVPLTLKDIDKIISLGFKIEDFTIVGEYKSQSIVNDEDWWKKSMIRINDKLFKINIKKKSDGSCFFLSDNKGCKLGKNRPFVCKIYPFWVNDKNKIIFESGEKEYCFMSKMGMSIEEVQREIKEDDKSINEYFFEIKRDCLSNKTEHEKIILKLLKKDVDKT